MTEAVTLDRFLNGRITVAQPVSGFRAGHDSVLLAAAVPAEPDSHVLELGSGAGVATLCLAALVSGARITGIEIDPDLVRLANENAARNAFADRVWFIAADVAITPHGSVDANLESTSPSWGGRTAASHSRESGSGGGQMPEGASLQLGSFDHVFFNPPFHPDSAHVSPVAARDRATRDSSDAVRAWTGRALALAREGGTVTAIVRADRVEEILDAARDYGGIVFPLLPRLGAAPKRTIVRILKRIGGRFSTAAGLILHESDGRSTEAAEAVLRHGRSLTIAP